MIKFFKKFLFIFGILSVASCHSQNVQLITPQQNQAVLEYAQTHFSQSGILKQSESGFVYLKVDDGYIVELFPMIKKSGYMEPLHLHGRGTPGAHISVFHEGELKANEKVKEIGKTFTFELSTLAVVPEKTHKWIILVVKCPELEALRVKYGASPLFLGQGFHIAISEKKKNRKNVLSIGNRQTFPNPTVR